MTPEEMLQCLISGEEESLPLEQKVRIAGALRTASPDLSQRLERQLLAQNTSMRHGLIEARAAMEQLDQRLREASQPPWFPATYLGVKEMSRGLAAMVCYAGQRRIVAIAQDELDVSSLRVGDEVLLSEALNRMLAVSPYRFSSTSETATFVRLLPDGRLLLQCHDEEVVAFAGESCDTAALHKGDPVRFDRAAMLAIEILPASTGEEYFVENTPVESFEEHVGGLDKQVDELRRALLIGFIHAGKAKLHGAGALRSVLLAGPTGNGKTLIARALANLIAKLSPSGKCCFAAVRPGAFGSIYYSGTERNIHNFCQSLRAAAERNPGVPIVAFFDEVDGIAGARSERDQRHYAEITNALLAELDGFEKSRFLIVSATNRLGSLDAAARRRLADLELRIPRPGRAAAADIFRKHLSLDRPYAGELPPAEAREQFIQAAVSAIFAPNGDNHLCTLMLRGGGSRKVHARELISGAEIQRIVSVAAGEACRRDIEYDECGLSLDDMLIGVDRFLESAAAPLTPFNIRNYLELEDDVDVVKVERPARPAANARLRVA